MSKDGRAVPGHLMHRDVRMQRLQDVKELPILHGTRTSLCIVCRERHDYMDVGVRATQAVKTEDAETTTPA